MRALALLAAAGASCNLLAPGGPDGAASEDARGPDADAEGEPSGDAEGGDAAPHAGPATLVIQTFEFGAERLCDLDGDGDLDNALADRGADAAAVITRVLSAAVAGAYEGPIRYLIHFPWIEDLRLPEDGETTVVVLKGIDQDWPPDEDDDFSGNEPYWVSGGFLDGCGEPVYVQQAGIRGGRLEAVSGIPVPLAFEDAPILLVRAGRAEGTVEPHFVSADLSVCGYVVVAELGAVPMADGPEVTLLELLLAGGAPLGIPGVSGVAPDLDLDGDGLETFVLDDSWHIRRCIDGDGATAIEGPSCWEDPRIADGVSLVVLLGTTRAVCGGSQEGWQADAQGECREPAGESTWQQSCGCGQPLPSQPPWCQ